MLRSMRYLLLLCAAILAVGHSPVQAADRAAAEKALLDAIPSDAWAYVAIPSLENLDGKVAMMSKKLGLPAQSLVGMAQGMLGLGELLDSAGGMAIVVTDFKTMSPEGIAMLMPSSDPDALIKKLTAAGGGDDEEDEDAPADKDVTKGMLMGQPVFAAKKGKFAVLGRSRDACIAVVKAKKSVGAAMEKQRLAAYGKSDVIISLAISKWLKQFEPQIKAMLPMLAAGAGGDATQITRQIDQLMKSGADVESTDLCIRMDESGVSIVGMGTPRGGSDLASTLSKRKPQKESLLARLPKETFAIAFGAIASEVTSKDIDELTETLPAQLKQFGDEITFDEDKVKSLARNLGELSKMLGKSAVAVSILPDGSDGVLGATAVVECSNPEEVISSLGKLVKEFKGLSDAEEFTKACEGVVHRVGAEDIGGAKVDTLSVDLAKLMPDIEAEEADSYKKLVGKDGFMLRFAQAGKDAVVFGVGGGKKRFATLIESASSKGAGLGGDAGITNVDKFLPDAKTAEFYVAIDAIVDGVQKTMATLGEDSDVPIKLGKINAPLGGSTTVDSGSGRLDLFVPMELITSLKDAFMAAQAGDDEDDEEDEAQTPPGQKSEDEDDE